MGAVGFAFPATLYPIVDDLGDSRRAHADIAAAMVRAGIRFLQLRVKDRSTRSFVSIARAVKKVTDAAEASLIINDRADIACLIDAAGVHLGQDDLPVAAARALLGQGKIIGVSTHNVAQAEAASRDGEVDYIGFGPIFPTTTKRNPDPVIGIDSLRRVRERVALPIVAIGGVTGATMRTVLNSGADAVAMVGAIVNADDIEARVRELIAPANPARD